MPFFDKGQKLGGLRRRIEQMIAAVLVSPDFPLPRDPERPTDAQAERACTR